MNSRSVELALKMTADASGVAKGADQAGKALDATDKAAGKSSKALKLIKGAGAAAAGGLAAVAATALIKGFGRLKGIEEAQAKLKGLGHDAKSIDAVMDSALESVKGTSFGLADAATAAASASAAGVENGAAMTKHLKLIANAAALTGKDFNSMGAIINKVTTNTKLSMGEVNQIQDAGIPIIQDLADHYGVATAEMSKMVSKGEVDAKTFNKVLTGTVGDAAQEMGKTFSGSLANMQASLGRIGANLLSGVYPKITKFFNGTTNMLGGVEDKAKVVGAAIGTYLATGINLVQSAIGPVRTALTAVVTTMIEWQDVLIPVAAAIGAIVVALKIYATVMAVITAATKAWAAVQAALNVVLSANPIGLVVLAVIGLVAALVVAYKRSETFRKAVQKGVAVMRTAWNGLRALIIAAWTSIQSRATSVMARITSITQTARTVITTTWNGIKSVATAIWNPIRTRATNTYDTIKTGIKTAKDVLTTAVNGMKTAAVNAFDAMIAPIKKVVDWVDSLIAKIKNIKLPSLPNPFSRTAGRGGIDLGADDPFAFTPRGATSSGPATVVNIEVNGALDPDAVARQIRTLLDRHDRRVTGLAS